MSTRKKMTHIYARYKIFKSKKPNKFFFYEIAQYTDTCTIKEEDSILLLRDWFKASICVKIVNLTCCLTLVLKLVIKNDGIIITVLLVSPDSPDSWVTIGRIHISL